MSEIDPPLIQRQAAGKVALELCDVTCMRGERMLFSRVDASIRGGELLRVLGPNGAGKTSLLRIICGLLMPQDGEVRWQGTAIRAQREVFNGQLVFLGDGAALKDPLSAAENLQSACALGGIACSPEDAARALDEAGLGACSHLAARNLSQGQRRRATLARLALPRPMGAAAGLWVLDEPFNALDTAASRWLLGLIRMHLAEGGVAVLTSHQDVALGDGLPQVVLEL